MRRASSILRLSHFVGWVLLVYGVHEVLSLGALPSAHATDDLATSDVATSMEVRVDGAVEQRPPRGRVVFLGVDGVPPALLRAAIDDGIVPNFAGIAERGVTGVVDVASTGLPPLSPRIWTTFVTGQLPKVHGILQFVVDESEEDEVLYSSEHRKVPAIWNVATKLGRRVGVVNWWSTVPAEPVDGFVVGDKFVDRFAETLKRDGWDGVSQGLSDVVYPPALLDELTGLTPVDQYVYTSPVRAERVDTQVIEMALIGSRSHPVDLLLLYVRGFDDLAHYAWHTHEALPGEDWGSDRVVEYLRRLDWLVGRVLMMIEPEDHLLVLSDHGFERYDDKKKKGGTHKTEKTALGLFMLSGPRVRRGVLEAPLDALDVMPTLLELLGLPAAADMPGRVAAEALRDGDLLPRVDSYSLVRRERRRIDPEVGDEARKERLRALGYLSDD